MRCETFPIEPNVPIHNNRTGGRSERLRQTLRQMKPGDSFLDSVESNCTYRIAKQEGMRITTRKVNGLGWRVWRIT